MKRLRPDDLRVGLKAQSLRGKRFRAGDIVAVAPRRLKRRRSRRDLGFPEEVKFFDTAVSFTFDLTAEVPATGQWALIPQGDTQSTRDGRLARIKSIQFRGVINGPTNVTTARNFLINMWVIQDKQANGAAAAVTDVFTGTNAAKYFLILKELMRVAC